MPRNVLYIDDDEGLRTLVTRGLGREGVAVVTAADGESGLKELAAQEFDVVAVDLYMPGMDGIATLERINQIANHPPVIVVTGTQDSRMAVAALKAGAFDYVVKDIGSDFIYLLKAALQAAIDTMHTRRAREVAEAEVHEARDRFEALAIERAMLLREVNHRVGNSLQIIASLLNMQGNGDTDPKVKAALSKAVKRVLAVAQVHRRLYTSADVQTVAVDQYLSALVDDLRASAQSDDLAQLTVLTDPVETEPDRAIAVGVIVNELVMNAIKYAYPDGSGPIRVGLKAQGADIAVISVEDDGIGYSGARAPGSTGLGQRIVKAMADKLGASVQHDQGHHGTKIEIAFALTRPALGARIS